MRYISADEVYQRLPMPTLIAMMEQALVDLTEGRAEMPLRSTLNFGERKIFGAMPAWLKSHDLVGTKLITIVHENRAAGRSASHQGLIALFSARDGSPLAIVDGESVTALRTAAVSAVATQRLAREDAKVLALLGTGRQAETHLAALTLVRRFSQVRVWGPHLDRARAFQERQAHATRVPIVVADSVSACVANADVICTLTASRQPILFSDQVRPGTHINAVGASRAEDRELDSALVARARLIVDRRESAQHEAGDYLIPLQEGVIEPEHIAGELGEVVVGRIAGRRSPSDLTLFKSLGLAVEDVAACAPLL